MEDMNIKNKSKKKLIIFVVITVLISIITSGTYVYNKYKEKKQKENEIKNQEKLLKNEVLNIVKSNLLNDSVSAEIKTKGKYAYIEKEIKKYYTDLGENLKIISSIFEDNNFKNLSSIDNIKIDDKELNNSFATLNKIKTKYNITMEKIKEICTKDKIANIINEKNVNDYYNSLYEELMFSDDDIDKINNYQEYTEELDGHGKKLLEKTEELIKYLKEENANWNIENNDFKANTEYIKLKYDQMVGVIKNEISDIELLNIEYGYKKK